MRYFKKAQKIILSAITIGFFISIPVGAESTNSTAAQGLQISPASVELNVSPGGTYNIPLTIMNVTPSELLFSSSIGDFTSQGETGSPKIILDSKLPVTASIKSWVSVADKFNLSGQQQKKITAQIKIPSNAEPGGHYGVISFAGSTPELNGNSVGLSASAGVLLLIRVDGKITEKADLAEFYTLKDNKQSSFFESGPINFVTRIKNDGNIHIRPSGSIEVRDMFGGLVKNIEINSDKKSSALPDSIRKFESKLDNGFMFGKYTANLALGYGTNGQAITSTIDFWVIPYKLVLIVVAGLGLLVFISSKLIRRYNRHIISRSKNEESNKKHKRGKS